MGAASSKGARKLPTKPQPTWAGARTGNPTQSQRPPLAKETKDQSIETDGQDPQLLAKLTRLGPVKVDHHMATFRTDDRMKKILLSRELSEQQASASSTRNRIVAASLAELLEERKYVKSKQDLEKLVRRYNIDMEVFHRLTEAINVPSVAKDTLRREVGKDGQERLLRTAVWIDTPVS